MSPLLIEIFLHLVLMEKKKRGNYVKMDWQTFFPKKHVTLVYSIQFSVLPISI